MQQMDRSVCLKLAVQLYNPTYNVEYEMRSYAAWSMCALFLFISLPSKADSICPAGQHWEASMKMCMPDQTPDDPTIDPTTFRGISANIFSKNCTSCHAQNGTDAPEAKIDLSSFQAMMTSNSNSANSKHSPFLVPGDPDNSKMYQAVKSGAMPATEDGDAGTPLSPEHIQQIYDWIKAGALDN